MYSKEEANEQGGELEKVEGELVSEHEVNLLLTWVAASSWSTAPLHAAKRTEDETG